MTIKLDTRGLNCPLPVLKAQKALRSLAPGERVTVLATDPKAPADFAQFCEVSGHHLLESSQRDGHLVLTIEKRG